jgi:hypothetical protein
LTHIGRVFSSKINRQPEPEGAAWNSRSKSADAECYSRYLYMVAGGSNCRMRITPFRGMGPVRVEQVSPRHQGLPIRHGSHVSIALVVLIPLIGAILAPLTIRSGRNACAITTGAATLVALALLLVNAPSVYQGQIARTSNSKWLITGFRVMGERF